ncbi:LLM class flavin-dependent oxidoreductase [Streptomyces lavendulae]|uniref:LLM class flavin-dependent oxidoreductase n=1 Tax=Streptomyces lavendulae TaxID=1914 RepID=UPI0024A5FA46|nr:LLM class flavin-dependent oxidoreductase [Streptomyces lavendulae]GLX17159.1 N5,N10-methylene tetrahydromethanopterin reductase [Streptomyces lavendulae subsp. lavendulae]GLX29667.1 N5,N10-methylene tetrahydromethanopterin reductase [Streptomyces lavendulae subsp. lavendulae]
MTEALRIGVLLPTREQAITRGYAAAPLLDFARRAEELGFDSVWAGDSLLARPRLDPLVVLSAVGAVTSRITLGTAALTAALRHPLTGAHMVASLDHVAASRLVLGLGGGFPVPETAEEFGAVGADYATRAGRLDETAALWRRAWNGCGPGSPADFEGRYWKAYGLERLPPPHRPGGPPLWLAGGDTPKVLRRVARRYDGWLPFLPSPEQYARAWQRLDAERADAGRPAGAVTPALYATLVVGRDEAAARSALDHYLRRYYGRSLEQMAPIQAYGWGSAERCAEWLAGYVRAGARHLVLRIGSLTPGPDVLEDLAGNVLPRLRALLPAPPAPPSCGGAP